MTRQFVINKNHVARSKVKVTVCTETSYSSVKPVSVSVQPITLSCLVGFENNVAQISIMTKQCVANKNHVARSKVKVTMPT